MKIVIALTLLLFTLAGCATAVSQSPQQAAQSAAILFEQQKFNLIWIPAADNAISGAMASALIGSAGLDSPIVSSIHQIIAPASEADVRVAISGVNSSFAANSAISALNNTSTMLPKLQLAFIGSKSDSEAVRSAVEAKGGKFLHSTPNGS
jgi:PBP1b-binding outer membrane lipoprotein LpoB